MSWTRNERRAQISRRRELLKRRLQAKATRARNAADKFSEEELEILRALRSCPESAIGQGWPSNRELTFHDAAVFIGTDASTVMYHIHRILERIHRAMDLDPRGFRGARRPHQLRVERVHE